MAAPLMMVLKAWHVLNLWFYQPILIKFTSKCIICWTLSFQIHYSPALCFTLNKDLRFITKTCLFKYTENFTTKKWIYFQIRNFLILFLFLLKTDCGYSLEPPRWGGSNKYPQSMFLNRNKKNSVYPYKPQFYYIKVGFKGVKII